MKILVSGNYRDETTTVHAKEGTTVTGQQYVFVSHAQLFSAWLRCFYAGDDYPVLSDIDGYGDWIPVKGGHAAYQVI